MVAIDDSASMLCARVMRGTSSMAISIAPRSATPRAAVTGGQRIGEADDDLSRRMSAMSAAPRRRIRAGRADLRDDVRLKDVGARSDRRLLSP